MKKLFVLFFSFLNINGFAQNNSISLGINTFYINNRNLTNSNTQFSNNSNKNFHVLPTIGYYKVIKKNKGLGCDIGYMKTKNTNNSESTNTNSGSTNLYKSSGNQFYICPIYFEIYNWQSFQFRTSLTLPISYYTKQISNTSSSYISGTNYYQNYNTTKSPNALDIDAFANFNIAKKVNKNLFIGVQIGVGINSSFTFKKGYTNQQNYENGILTINNESNTNNTNSTSSGLSIKPTISAYYTF